MAILGSVYKDQAASAFGLFKFAQSFATAVYFFYSSYLGFYWQLLIVAIFNILGTITSVRLELWSRRQ